MGISSFQYSQTQARSPCAANFRSRLQEWLRQWLQVRMCVPFPESFQVMSEEHRNPYFMQTLQVDLCKHGSGNHLEKRHSGWDCLPRPEGLPNSQICSGLLWIHPCSPTKTYPFTLPWEFPWSALQSCLTPAQAIPDMVGFGCSRTSYTQLDTWTVLILFHDVRATSVMTSTETLQLAQCYVTEN